MIPPKKVSMIELLQFSTENLCDRLLFLHNIYHIP